MPKVRLALLSDEIDPDEDHDTYSIMRIFDRKTSAIFPVKKNFVVSVFWDVLGIENFDQSFFVSDKEGTILRRTEPLRVVLGKPQEITFVRFSNVLFYVPGIYTVAVLVNGERVYQVPFVIEQLNLHDMAL